MLNIKGMSRRTKNMAPRYETVWMTDGDEIWEETTTNIIGYDPISMVTRIENQIGSGRMREDFLDEATLWYHLLNNGIRPSDARDFIYESGEVLDPALVPSVKAILKLPNGTTTITQ